MFFHESNEKLDEIPVEVLHRAKPQQSRRKHPPRRESLRTTESIISEKVKKYLSKLFAGTRFETILEQSSSSLLREPVTERNIERNIERNLGDLKERPTNVSFVYPPKKTNKRSRSTKKLFPSFGRNSIAVRQLRAQRESLNNLFTVPSRRSTHNAVRSSRSGRKIKFRDSTFDIPEKNILKDRKSTSFCEIVDQFIKKQKKKQMRSARKLKKPTKSSISMMCDRAKLLLHDSFTEKPESTNSDDSLSEDQEEVLVIHELNNFEGTKSSGECVNVIASKSLDVHDLYTTYHVTNYKCKANMSNCANLHHYSSELDLERLQWGQDFETDLETWTADYIDGLVAVTNPTRPNLTPTPGKKKCKSVKTKSRKGVRSDVNKTVKDDARHLTALGRNSQPVEAVMERPHGGGRKGRKHCDAYTCQRIQDIQNYIDGLMVPADVPKPPCFRVMGEGAPQKQSIQELKKFQRELKIRIRELERNVPATKHCFLDKNKPKFDVCRRCSKQVYLVERICAGDGVYHNFCYVCYSCERRLNSLNLCVTKGEVFCKQCFQKYFGPEVYGFIK